MTLQRFLLILQARWRLVAGVLAGVVLLTLAVNLLLPRKYTAEAAVLVDSRPADPILGAILPVSAANSLMATQVDIILSDGVAQKVVSQLKLDQDEEMRRQWQSETGGHGSLRAWLAGGLQRQLKVLPTRESNVISLTYTDRDPQLATAVVNAFAQAYIDTNLGQKVGSATQYAQWFGERTQSLRDKLEAAQQRLSSYQQAEQIIVADNALDVESARLTELSSQLVLAQGLRAETNSRWSQAGTAETLPEVIGNPLIQSLKNRLAELEAQHQKLALQLGSAHPERARVASQITAVRAQIAGETGRVGDSLGSAGRMNAVRVAELGEAVKAQEKKVLELGAKRDRGAMLQREVKSAQRDYDMVTQRLAQTSLESTMPQTNVSILTVATEPPLPSSPKILLNTALSALFGGLLGVGLALLREQANRRLRNPMDLPELLGVPLLAVLPAPGPSWQVIDGRAEPYPSRGRGLLSRFRGRLPHLQAEP